MQHPSPKDPISIALRIANILVLLFWIIYFVNAILPAHTTVEVIKDFDEFNIAGPGGGTNTSYKKMVTKERNFTVYTNENEFFTNDTLQLVVTPIFGLVTNYREFSPRHPQPWIHNELSRYTNKTLLTISFVLTLLSVFLVLSRLNPTLYKTLCLLNIIGFILIFLSVVT